MEPPQNHQSHNNNKTIWTKYNENDAKEFNEFKKALLELSNVLEKYSENIIKDYEEKIKNLIEMAKITQESEKNSNFENFNNKKE